MCNTTKEVFEISIGAYGYANETALETSNEPN